jgi:hypothetical protein
VFGARLDSAAILSSTVSAGTITSLVVNALQYPISASTSILLPSGQAAQVTAAGAAAGATSIPINSITITVSMASGAPIYPCASGTDSTYRGGYVHVSKDGSGTGAGTLQASVYALWRNNA